MAAISYGQHSPVRALCLWCTLLSHLGGNCHPLQSRMLQRNAQELIPHPHRGRLGPPIRTNWCEQRSSETHRGSQKKEQHIGNNPRGSGRYPGAPRRINSIIYSSKRRNKRRVQKKTNRHAMMGCGNSIMGCCNCPRRMARIRSHCFDLGIDKWHEKNLH